MTKYKIKLAPPDIDESVMDILSKRFATAASNPNASLHKLEHQFTELMGSKYALLLNSGTSAIHLALLAVGVELGDEVICPSFTFAATINAISYINATPIIIDSEEKTWNMSPDLLQKAIVDRIEKGKKPKAVLVAHTYGMPCQLEEILEICREYDIPLVEDAAGSLGAKYKGKMLGTFGDVGIISFNYNKIITTMGGGLLLTDNEAIRKKSYYLSTQAKSAKPFYHHEEVGYNYQMHGLSAELGLLQLDLLEERVEKKRSIHNLYFEALNDFSDITFLKEQENFFSSYWLSTVVLKDEGDVVRLKKHLSDSGVEARFLWNPMHRQPVFSEYPSYLNGVSDNLFKHGLALPSGTGLTKEQQQFVIKMIMDFLG